MDNKIIALIAVAILVVAGVGIYIATDNNSANKDNDTTGGMVTDALGREVTVPESLNNGIITIGSSGPLRFLSMFDVYDKIIEVDKGDVTDSKNGRAYSYAYSYDSIKAYHADNALDSETVESIAKKKPSLVVTTVSVWNNYQTNFETLSKVCTVLVLNDQSMKSMTDVNGKLDSYFSGNLDMIGKILGKESRAKELASGMESIVADLKKLSGTSEKNVYVAGVTINGSNTLNTTFPVYFPFNLVNANNAYKGDSTAYKVVLNVEQLAKMKIDLTIIDPSSSNKLAEQDSQLVMKYIHGINNDSDKTNDIPLYVTVPIVWDSINYDCALASAYYIEYLLYGTLTHDQVVKKIENVFKVFYGDHGKNVLSDMSKFFVEKSSANNVELPILSEVKIVLENGKYLFKAA